MEKSFGEWTHVNHELPPFFTPVLVRHSQWAKSRMLVATLERFADGGMEWWIPEYFSTMRKIKFDPKNISLWRKI